MTKHLFFILFCLSTLCTSVAQGNTGGIRMSESEGRDSCHIRSANLIPLGLTDTYWRSEQTGDWFIGFTGQCVIYDNAFWDIASLTAKKDACQLTLTKGTERLDVKVGRLKDGRRTIRIGKKQKVECSPITTKTLPDYPTKDTRKGFVDNGYRMGDSITLVGWLKDMPEKQWRKGREFEVSYVNLLSGSAEDENVCARMDSIGRFTLRMPLLNSTQVFLDWGRTFISTVLEPGNTYFLLSDYKTGQRLFMGTDARVQNELLACPYRWINERIRSKENRKTDGMNLWARTDSIRNALMEELHERIAVRPNLSQRYIDYVTGYYRTGQAESMMQARFAVKDGVFPKEYMRFVGEELWQKAAKPYTLYRDFNTFMRDYLDQLGDERADNCWIDPFLRMVEAGDATLTDEELKAARQYSKAYRKLFVDLGRATSEAETDSLVAAFEKNGFVSVCMELLQRYAEEITLSGIRHNLMLIDSVGCDRNLRDIYLSRILCRRIDAGRSPFDASVMELMQQEMELPAAKRMVTDLQEKYLAIQRKEISKSAGLKSGDEVKEMSDGGQILRKLIEPYKGRMILLDVWGTWCGPCKAALAKSKEEYERLAPYDMVFLYLANRSGEESWKNVIKEYNVVGDNVVHYNLPAAQQSAVERFLGVSSFPTYRLIDKEGRILDANADPRDLDGLVRLIESLR